MRSSILLVAAFLLSCVSSSPVFAESGSSSAYDDAIAYVRGEGLMRGYPDGSFRASQPINRAEMVKVLMEVAGDHGVGAYCFSDVQSEWFAPYVCAARAHGMVNGYPDGTFRPAQTVSFVEGAAMLVREREGNLPAVDDTWYMPYVVHLEEMRAVPPAMHSMSAPLTRGDVAFMVWRAALDRFDNVQKERDRTPIFREEAVIVPETSLGDPVLYWNTVADQALANDYSGVFSPVPEQNGPGPASRALAMIHAAMYDAVNSIDRTHEPYRILVALPSDTPVSVDAAVAQAAYQTLVASFPAQKIFFDAALDHHVSLLPDDSAKAAGVAVGRIAAGAVLADRVSDGWNRAIRYAYNILPGFHRPDPTNPTQAIWGPGWGYVQPFVLRQASQFRSVPPPVLDSVAYAAAFQEVKILGGDGVTTPTVRTPEQTQIGIFWAYDGTRNMGTPPRHYNEIAASIARQQGNSVVENARYFALIDLAMADAGIAAWESKFFYNYWRPIVAIREADAGTGPSGVGDGNAATTGDAQWTPLGAPASNRSSETLRNFTPAFPAYPSGHAAFGAAVFRTIANFYGTDDIAFTFTSHEFDGITTDSIGVVRPVVARSFRRLSDAAYENAESRLFLGIHWRFDATAGIDMGNSVADFVYDSVLRPVGSIHP